MGKSNNIIVIEEKLKAIQLALLSIEEEKVKLEDQQRYLERLLIFEKLASDESDDILENPMNL